MNEAVTQSLIGQINAAHEKCRAWSMTLVDAVIQSINAARETGIYLIELEEQTPHGKWVALFRCRQFPDAPINFNDVTASRWIRLARALPDPITKESLPDGVRHLTDMLRVVQALPEPSGHGEQNRHEPRSPFQSLVKLAGDMQGCLSGWRKEKPLDQWDVHLLEQVDSQMEPVAKFHREVREMLARKQINL